MTRRGHPTRAVVFDFDGTLVDSLPLVLRSIAYALEPFGARPTMEIFAKLGGPPERFMPDLVADPRDGPAAVQRMEEFHTRNQHLIHPFDGLHGVLDRLRTGGVALAIWTGRDRASTEELLHRHELTRYFSAVVCGDDLPTHKPDPQGLHEILCRLEVPAQEAIMVGDADVDVLGAAASGVDAILIRHDRNVEAEVGAKSWRVVATPPDAFALLLECLA